MQFTVVALSALAGLALASPQAYNAGDGTVVTVTTMTTQEITVTDCAVTVTDCPARTSTSVFPVMYTTIVEAIPYTSAPVAPAPIVAAATGATGTGVGNAYGGQGKYNMPQPTGYTGPSFTGAGNKLAAGGAVAAIGAVAALLI